METCVSLINFAKKIINKHQLFFFLLEAEGKRIEKKQQNHASFISISLPTLPFEILIFLFLVPIKQAT
jgi:hypothetical protein